MVCQFRVSYYKQELNHSAAPTMFLVLHAYVDTDMKGFEQRTFGSVFLSEVTEGQYFEALQNCKSTKLPSFDSWYVSFRVSYYKGEPDHAADTYQVLELVVTA